MAVSDSFRDFVRERLGKVTTVHDRRMFGGIGIYAGEHFFALIDENTLYFKVDDTNRGDYEAEGMEAFRPYGPDGGAMGYYQVPADVLEDDEKLGSWAKKAIDVARRRKRPKK